MTAPQERANPVEIDDLTAMIELVKSAGWRQVRLRMGDFELELSDGALEAGRTDGQAAAPAPAAASAPVASPAPAAPAAQTVAPTTGPVEEDGEGVVVRAQSIGIFWRSPQPGAPPFVEIGDTVQTDTPLAIVEVMKMMTRIEPTVGGVVTAVHVENGDVVEFDQPLFTIRPA
jgi:acetyl-CoA carboxylase biotin carboxyl carrier protein